MSDFRIPYGLALGKFANFYAQTANVFAQADSSPDVTLGSLFFSNNSTNTTITDFEFSVTGPIPGMTSHGSVASQFEGKLIKVVFLDDSTRLVNNASLTLAGSNGLQGANNSIELVYHNSSWIEFGRSYNNNNVVNVSSASLNSTAAAGTALLTIRGRGSNVVLYLAAEATTPLVLNRVIGAEPGTQLTIIASGGSDALVHVNSASNVDGTFVSVTSGISTQFRLASSASILFTKFGTRWIEARPVFINSSAIGVS